MSSPENRPETEMFNDYLGKDKTGRIVFNEQAISDISKEVFRGISPKYRPIAERAFLEKLKSSMLLTQWQLSGEELKQDPIKWEQYQKERESEELSNPDPILLSMQSSLNDLK